MENNENFARIDGNGCFVEAVPNGFGIGKCQLNFVSYDKNRPAGQRQTGFISIYLDLKEFFNIFRMLQCGAITSKLNEAKAAGQTVTFLSHLGGTSVEALAAKGHRRPDGMALSRTCSIISGMKKPIILTASQGAGQKNMQGLIVPRFGNNPDTKILVPMTIEDFTFLFYQIYTHYNAYVTAQYCNPQH